MNVLSTAPNKNLKGLLIFQEFLKKQKNLPINERVDKILSAIQLGKVDNKELNIDSRTKNLILKSIKDEYVGHLNYLQQEEEMQKNVKLPHNSPRRKFSPNRLNKNKYSSPQRGLGEISTNSTSRLRSPAKNQVYNQVDGKKQSPIKTKESNKDTATATTNAKTKSNINITPDRSEKYTNNNTNNNAKYLKSLTKSDLKKEFENQSEDTFNENITNPFINTIQSLDRTIKKTNTIKTTNEDVKINKAKEEKKQNSESKIPIVVYTNKGFGVGNNSNSQNIINNVKKKGSQASILSNIY